MIKLKPECGIIADGVLKVIIPKGTEMAPGYYLDQALVMSINIAKHEEGVMGHGIVDRIWIDGKGRISADKNGNRISKAMGRGLIAAIGKHCGRVRV